MTFEKLRKFAHVVLAVALGWAAVQGMVPAQTNNYNMLNRAYYPVDPGTTGYCWTSNGASAIPSWQACSAGGAGTVTSVNASCTAPLACAGGPITGAGTLTFTWAGANINGTPALGDMLYAADSTTLDLVNGTGLLKLNGSATPTVVTTSSTVGQILRVTGANTYAWGALDLADTDAVTGALPLTNGGTGATTATAARAALNTTYVMQGQAGLSSPSDSLVVYVGNGSAAPQTTAQLARVSIPRTGTLTAAYLTVGVAGTLGDSATGTVAFRLNNSANTSIGTVAWTSVVQTVTNTSLGVSVTAGDTYELQLTNANWLTTDPTNVVYNYVLLFAY